jgi:hypothetical protein
MRLVTTELLHPAEQSLEYYRVGRAAESPCVDRQLVYKGAPGSKVYWQGPSIGFDVGANAVKTFILVYGAPNVASLYKRFPGVEGSLYFVGGFGVNYVQRDGIALAPVRFGVGWRQGIALSYMNFSRERRYNPL